MKGYDTKKAVNALKQGKIVIFPTDTAYGIGCRIDDEDAIQRLYAIRRRPENKPILALVDSIEMAQEYLQPISESVRTQLMDRYWPGGLTLILDCNRVKVPKLVRAGGGTLAVRLPDHKILQNIIREVGVPILAPSANFSGGKTPYEFEDIDPSLISLVDYALIGDCTYKEQSTVLDCTKKPWTVVREGVVKVRTKYE